MGNILDFFDSRDVPVSHLDLRSYASLTREFFWDLVACQMAVELMAPCGLIPGSDDVEEAEHQASHDRLAEIEHLRPVLELFCDISGEVLAKVMMYLQGADELDEQAREAFVFGNQKIALAIVTAVLANMVDKGIVYFDHDVIVRAVEDEGEAEAA